MKEGKNQAKSEAMIILDITSGTRRQLFISAWIDAVLIYLRVLFSALTKFRLANWYERPAETSTPHLQVLLWCRILDWYRRLAEPCYSHLQVLLCCHVRGTFILILSDVNISNPGVTWPWRLVALPTNVCTVCTLLNTHSGINFISEFWRVCFYSLYTNNRWLMNNAIGRTLKETVVTERTALPWYFLEEPKKNTNIRNQDSRSSAEIWIWDSWAPAFGSVLYRLHIYRATTQMTNYGCGSIWEE